MANCQNCWKQVSPTKTFCDECLNSWPTMKRFIVARNSEQFGPDIPREMVPLLDREIKRMDLLWRRDRQIFETELSNKINAGT